MADSDEGSTEDLLAARDQLLSARRDLDDDVEDLRRYGRRNRNLIRLTIVSVVFDICLTGLVYTTAHRADVAAAQARAATVSVRVTCESGNEVRAAIAKTLNDLTAGATPQPGETPAQVAAGQARLRQYIAANLAPRDCGR